MESVALTLTAVEASKLLGISDKTFRKLVAAGRIPSVRIAKAKRYARATIERIAEKGIEEATAAA